MNRNNFYITTTLPYVNAEPHIGFAMEIIRADAIARYNALQGKNIFFNTGVDEHGQKIYEKARERGEEPQAYVDEYAEKFRGLKSSLGLWSGLNFIRTTDKHHVEATKEFWKRCDKNGDIYKKNYKTKYCVGCELEKTDSELDEHGCCPIHPTQKIQIVEEENYFFRFSNYQNKLLALYAERPDFVLPSFRLGEIKNFVECGLEDFSISRLKSKMPWGVPVPSDNEHVMYVWFDALVSYISAIGWPQDEEKFNTWWPVTQIAGKDNLRQQSAMWQAMLMSAGIEPSRQILVEGFITSAGQKMSKSSGNVINPMTIVNEYGLDALRIFLLKEIPMFDDGDVTMERFATFYNADLVNGLGNIVSRVMKMAEDHLSTPIERPERGSFADTYQTALDVYDLPVAVTVAWERIEKLDKRITDEEPFKLVKNNMQRGQALIIELVAELYVIARMLQPFIPKTSDIMKATILENKKPKNLFPRK